VHLIQGPQTGLPVRQAPLLIVAVALQNRASVPRSEI
jgi:hypothetical protein